MGACISSLKSGRARRTSRTKPGQLLRTRVPGAKNDSDARTTSKENGTTLQEAKCSPRVPPSETTRGNHEKLPGATAQQNVDLHTLASHPGASIIPARTDISSLSCVQSRQSSLHRQKPPDASATLSCAPQSPPERAALQPLIQRPRLEEFVGGTAKTVFPTSELPNNSWPAEMQGRGGHHQDPRSPARETILVGADSDEPRSSPGWSTFRDSGTQSERRTTSFHRDTGSAGGASRMAPTLETPVTTGLLPCSVTVPRSFLTKERLAGLAALLQRQVTEQKSVLTPSGHGIVFEGDASGGE